MTTDQHLNTGAMALGALPEDEAASFGEHLRTCPTCSEELIGFLETAATLGASVAQTPPAGLRRSVMDAISLTPQLPPLTGSVSDLGRHRQPSPADSTAAAGPSATDLSATDVSAAELQTAELQIAEPQTAAELQRAAQSPRAGRGPWPAGSGIEETTPHLATIIPLNRPWYRRPQALLAAAVALLVIGGGTGVVLSNRSSAPPSAGARVAAAADRAVLAPTVGAGGDVTLAPSCDAVVVKMPNLPAPPAGKVYQLWVIKGSTASSAGVVKQNSDGSFSAVTTGVRAGDTAVGVTVEPSPGSVKPTTKPFWVVPLAA